MVCSVAQLYLGATVVCRKPVVPHWDRSGIHLLYSTQLQREARDITSNNHSELRKLLLQVLTNAMETQNTVDMQSSGEPVAERIMEAGQMSS